MITCNSWHIPQRNLKIFENGRLAASPPRLLVSHATGPLSRGHVTYNRTLHRVQRSEVPAEPQGTEEQRSSRTFSFPCERQPTYLRYSRYLDFYRRSNYCGLLGALRSTSFGKLRFAKKSRCPSGNVLGDREV